MAAPYMAGIKEKEAKGENLSLLILGMGSGTYATQLSRYFENIDVEGVEIDDKITDLAHKYFELPSDTKVTTYDGRAYLAAIDGKYDVIMVDAYQDITIPFQMSSVEFFTMVKEHLSPGGVMVVNMNMYSEDDNAATGNFGSDGQAGTTADNATINNYLADTISSVFSNVVTVKVPYTTNRELFASDSDEFLERLSANTQMEDNETLRSMMQKVSDTYVPYVSTGHLMTDDKAPVELLGMKQIDLIIKDEVSFYRHIFETKGLQGLLDLL